MMLDWTTLMKLLNSGSETKTYQNPYGGQDTKYGPMNFDTMQQQQAPQQGMSLGGLLGASGMSMGGGGGSGRANAEQLGMSALGQYQPMDQYANPGVTMNLLSGAANTPRQNYRQQAPSYQNSYIKGLLGG